MSAAHAAFFMYIVICCIVKQFHLYDPDVILYIIRTHSRSRRHPLPVPARFAEAPAKIQRVQ